LLIWILAAIAFIGFGAGFIFKVPFVILLSVGIVICLGTIAVIDEWPALAALGTIALAVLALQIAYIVGVALAICGGKRRQTDCPI
jgi:hypothetical protein